MREHGQTEMEGRKDLVEDNQEGSEGAQYAFISDWTRGGRWAGSLVEALLALDEPRDVQENSVAVLAISRDGNVTADVPLCGLAVFLFRLSEKMIERLQELQSPMVEKLAELVAWRKDYALGLVDLRGADGGRLLGHIIFGKLERDLWLNGLGEDVRHEAEGLYKALYFALSPQPALFRAYKVLAQMKAADMPFDLTEQLLKDSLASSAPGLKGWL